MNIRDNSNYREGNSTIPVIISRSEPAYAPDSAIWARPVKVDGTGASTECYIKEILLLYKKTGGNSTFVGKEDLGFPIETAATVKTAYLDTLLSADTVKKLLPSKGWACVGVYDDGLPMWAEAAISAPPEPDPKETVNLEDLG